MRFEILKEDCNGYEIKRGTEAGTSFDGEHATVELENKFYKDFDSFYDMDCNKLCKGEDGKLYAVMFDSRDSEKPYIWKEVATNEENTEIEKSETKLRLEKAKSKKIKDIYGRVLTVDESHRKFVCIDKKTGFERYTAPIVEENCKYEFWTDYLATA